MSFKNNRTQKVYLKKNIAASFIFSIFILTAVFSTGCNDKKEEVKSPEVINQSDTSGMQNSVDTMSMNKENKNKVADLTGTWTGKFDSRTTTLKITSQDSTSFEGKITINYREVINQDVKGTFNPDKMTVSMTDQLHSRYMGKYNAKLSSDTTTLSGVFTMNVDGKKLNFNLTKK